MLFKLTPLPPELFDCYGCLRKIHRHHYNINRATGTRRTGNLSSSSSMEARSNRTSDQGFMQDENVACHDIGKLSFERAVGCFGTPQLERAARFPMPQLERVTCFAMPQLERATRFPNVPSRVATRFRMFQFEHE